jgi:polyhydroxyalkanoate synthase
MSGGTIDPRALAAELAELARRGAALASAWPSAMHAVAGAHARETIWRHGRIALHRYRPVAPTMAGGRPLLVVFALVNRPEVLDLETGRSMIGALLAHGVDVHLVDWGRAGSQDHADGLARYVLDYLDGAVEALCDRAGVAAIDVLGVCQGGTLALCHAALRPRRIAGLVTMVTPVDFRTPDDLLSRWAQALDVEALVRPGNVPGALLNAAFVALKPFELGQQKYVHLLDHADDPARLASFVRLERWIHDSPDQPAALFRDYVARLYQENRLARGTLEIGGERVRLDAIRQPILNVYALRDHIVPPDASIALGRLVGSPDYTALAVDTGHIGMYVSREAREVPTRVAEWLRSRASARTPRSRRDTARRSRPP